MADIIVIAILAVIFFLIIRYIVKSKKKGIKCIGCEHATKCASKNCNEE